MRIAPGSRLTSVEELEVPELAQPPAVCPAPESGFAEARRAPISLQGTLAPVTSDAPSFRVGFGGLGLQPAADEGPTYSMPPVSPKFIGSIYSPADVANQPFSTGADFFSPMPGHVDEAMSLARVALAQGHEPIISLHNLVLDEHKALRPDAAAIIEGLKVSYPDLMNRPGATFEAVDEVFWDTNGTGSDQHVKQAADQAIATLDLLHSSLPDAHLVIVACPEVWRTDLHSSQQANPAVVPEFARILSAMKPGDVAATDPYAWSMDEHDAVAKLEAAKEFNTFVKANAPGIETCVIAQGFVPAELHKPAAEWTPQESHRFADFLNAMFTTAQDFDRTMVWGGASALDGLGSVFECAPKEITDLYQSWALKLGSQP